MVDDVVLTIDGAVDRPLRLTRGDLDSLPPSAHVCDVSRIHPKRQGDGVEIRAILEQAGVHADANYLTLHADRDDFHVSIPLQPVRDQGIVVYRLGDGPLGSEHGGPIRFLVSDPSACNTGELDECANVKYLSRIELTTRRGRDTRPADEAQHAETPSLPGGGFGDRGSTNHLIENENNSYANCLYIWNLQSEIGFPVTVHGSKVTTAQKRRAAKAVPGCVGRSDEWH